MMEHDLGLLLKYPLISCEARDGLKHYYGIITVEHNDYKVDVIEEICNESCHFKLITIFGNEIDGNIAKIEATNIVNFLDKLAVTLHESLAQIKAKNYVNVYRRVLYEYSEFIKFHLKIKKSELSADLSTIQATTVDEGGREHSIHIKIDCDEIKDIYRVVDLKLPEQVCKDFIKSFANLTDIFGKFLSVIEMLQPFFDVMEDLDRNCCVLDPETPCRKNCYRRIWLDQNLSVVITIDPSNVKVRPDLKFLGPERLILRYREKLNKKIEEWDTNTDLLEGLLNIIEMENFPSKPESKQEVLMDAGECSICFSLRFNDNLPEIICGNNSCEKFYHTECLYEWLTSVNSKRIFNEIRGECPNCEKGISCPIPERDNVTVGGVM